MIEVDGLMAAVIPSSSAAPSADAPAEFAAAMALVEGDTGQTGPGAGGDPLLELEVQLELEHALAEEEQSALPFPTNDVSAVLDRDLTVEGEASADPGSIEVARSVSNSPTSPMQSEEPSAVVPGPPASTSTTTDMPSGNAEVKRTEVPAPPGPTPALASAKPSLTDVDTLPVALAGSAAEIPVTADVHLPEDGAAAVSEAELSAPPAPTPLPTATVAGAGAAEAHASVAAATASVPRVGNAADDATAEIDLHAASAADVDGAGSGLPTSAPQVASVPSGSSSAVADIDVAATAPDVAVGGVESRSPSAPTGAPEPSIDTAPTAPLPDGPVVERATTVPQPVSAPTPTASAIADAVELADVPTPRTATPEATPTQQVAEALREVRRLADGSHRLSLQLHPEELGAVQLEVAIREGQLHVRAVAETDAARSALEQNLPELRSELRDAGVRAGSLEVGPDASGQDRPDRSDRDGRAERADDPRADDPPTSPPDPSTPSGLDIRL